MSHSGWRLYPGAEAAPHEVAFASPENHTLKMFQLDYEWEWLVVATLVFLTFLLIVLGLREFHQLSRSITKIPIRIHVNGSRGKSSVTRLISAGLKAGGLKVLAKTTGTAPRVIDYFGQDRPIHRLRSASISEQIKVLENFSAQKPDAVVLECMAVQPQYQWICEQQMVRATLGVITNVRPDHLAEMGPSLKDVALSLSNTIPKNGQVIIGGGNFSTEFEAVAARRDTKVNIAGANTVSAEESASFPETVHEDNIAVALRTCELAGIERGAALEGMLTAAPDPGAAVFMELHSGKKRNIFFNALAANDPESTSVLWSLTYEKSSRRKVCIFLNSREDRRQRTRQLLPLIGNQMLPDLLVIRGDHIPAVPNIDGMKVKIFPDSTQPEEVAEYLMELDDHLIFAMGNIVGWGHEFLDHLRENYLSD